MEHMRQCILNKIEWWDSCAILVSLYIVWIIWIIRPSSTANVMASLVVEDVTPLPHSVMIVNSTSHLTNSFLETSVFPALSVYNPIALTLSNSSFLSCFISSPLSSSNEILRSSNNLASWTIDSLERHAVQSDVSTAKFLALLNPLKFLHYRGLIWMGAFIPGRKHISIVRREVAATSIFVLLLSQETNIAKRWSQINSLPGCKGKGVSGDMSLKSKHFLVEGTASW